MVAKTQESLPLDLHRAALLCIDLQHLCCTPGVGGLAHLDECDWSTGRYAWFIKRINDQVLPTTRRLQQQFRRGGLEVIHVRVQSLTQDGRDRSYQHRRLGSLAAPGSREAEFLDGIEPQGDELIINKTACSVFNSTNIHYVLSNLGIEALVLVGCETSECIESAARDASDLGYRVYVVEDGVASYYREDHENALSALHHTFASIVTEQEVIAELGGVMPPPDS